MCPQHDVLIYISIVKNCVSQLTNIAVSSPTYVFVVRVPEIYFASKFQYSVQY